MSSKQSYFFEDSLQDVCAELETKKVKNIQWSTNYFVVEFEE